MDPRKCQTATASPAEPGELPIWLEDALIPVIANDVYWSVGPGNPSPGDDPSK
jgi:hypothetical protein